MPDTTTQQEREALSPCPFCSGVNIIHCGHHVMCQHEGYTPFTYATFHYDYAYTSNAGTYNAANELAVKLGAKEPVEHRSRPFNFPKESP